MRHAHRFLFICCLAALAAPMCSTAVAQDEPTARPQQLETLRGQIASAREELATERERAQALEVRLACTEELLQDYHACGDQHEMNSPPYWDCVQRAIAGEDKCRGVQTQNNGP